VTGVNTRFFDVLTEVEPVDKVLTPGLTLSRWKDTPELCGNRSAGPGILGKPLGITGAFAIWHSVRIVVFFNKPMPFIVVYLARSDRRPALPPKPPLKTFAI
jgi:hypothetical protein